MLSSAGRSRSLLRFSTPRLAGGADDAKPRWTLPAKDYLKHAYQPSIPDKHFFGANWNYAPITMWLRQRRPAMEKIGCDVYSTLSSWGKCAFGPVCGAYDRLFPGFLVKILGLFSIWLGFSSTWNWQFGTDTDNWMFLDKMKSYGEAQRLAAEGFWRTAEQEKARRESEAKETFLRLNDLWESAIDEATKTGKFETLCASLEVDHENPPLTSIPQPVAFRFSMIPYGSENPDTKVFPVADADAPGGPYEFLGAGSHGDYITHHDYVYSTIKKAKQLFAGAYIPPTQ